MAVAMVLGFMQPSAMADQPSETTRVVCSRVEIQLPHDIVFYSNQGTIDARVETNIGPGQYTIRYLSTERQLEVSPWGNKAQVIDISLNGGKTHGRRYQACIESLVEPVPLVVVGAGNGSNAGSSTAKSDSAGTTTAASTATQGEGTGGHKGRPEGSAQGKAGARKTAEQGALVSENATTFGKGRVAHGMKGGTGPDSAAGVASGGALIPLINVPASLRILTENLLIMQDANPGQLASGWMSKIGSKTTVYRLRKKLASSASDYAEKRLDSFLDELDEAMQGMAQHEREFMRNRWKWEIQRQYFGRVEKGASDKLLDTSLSAAERRHAETLLEAAKVKPVAGQLPRNHKYAGKELPRKKLPQAYKDKGLRFTEDGFPDFGPYAQTLPNGQKSVHIQYTGSYKKDNRLAAKAAGFDPPEIPDTMVWHHHHDGVSMQLVPKDLHRDVRHTGGRGIYQHASGDPNVYK